jgi:hypothetical protein
MELALRWRGYVVGISVAKRLEAEGKEKPAQASLESPDLTQGCRDKAWRDHAVGAGSRYVGPIR